MTSELYFTFNVDDISRVEIENFAKEIENISEIEKVEKAKALGIETIVISLVGSLIVQILQKKVLPYVIEKFKKIIQKIIEKRKKTLSPNQQVILTLHYEYLTIELKSGSEAEIEEVINKLRSYIEN